ncbi:MAG: universal stress protein [Campylobacteraceae bacterium]|jgi:nucleotide-binding universal stress UspA family protein|nr:universal stress protein [Campylobacteraceae bacterium]
MEQIVAALAMHESDLYVIEKSEELRKRTGAKVTYVHAVVSRFLGKSTDIVKIKEELQNFVKKTADINDDDIVVSISSGWELILKTVKEKDADLVVLGNMSKSHAVLYLGSTVKKVLERIGAPVFIARSKPLDNKILIPTDLGDYTMKASVVKKFLKSNAPVSYVYADASAFGEIATPYTTLAAYSVEYMQEEMEKQLKEFKKNRTDAPIAILEVEESVSEAIKKYAQENDYTLMVLASRNIAGLNPIIFGSTASKIAQIVDANLLITFVEE